MTDRLDELARRIDGLDKLSAVIGGMRGMAAARVREAEAALASMDRYATALAAALDRARTLLPEIPPPPAAAVVVVFLAQQGFAGGGSGRVLDALPLDRSGLVLVGSRGAALAAEQGIVPCRTHALPARPAGLPRFAEEVARGLPLAGGSPVDVVHLPAARSAQVARRRVFPFPAGTGAPTGPAPLLNLARGPILEALLLEALHAGLMRAALEGMAAEHLARMATMAAAERQAGDRLETLRAAARQVRQETITVEIVELSAGIKAR